MITLYELHWSHYCEKIRWALDFKKLHWNKININAFNKREMAAFPKKEKQHLVPFIYDDNTNLALGDSTPILNYLENTYPEPRLFPQDETKKQLIYEWLIELDSKLGIIGRRLGYTQLIIENPAILADLFLAKKCKGFFALPGIRKISGALLGMLLIKRFHLEMNESLCLYEELETFLLSIAEKLRYQKYLFDNQFTAADLTLAVYLRPLTIIPYFKEHAKLANLFNWQNNIFNEHKREEKLLYQTLIAKYRIKHPPTKRINTNVNKNSKFMEYTTSQYKTTLKAYNDQEPIWTWSILKVPYYYFIIRKK